MKDKNKMLLMLGFMAFLANGDNYAAAPLIINISRDLNLTVDVAALSVMAYMLSFGLFTLLFGPLSDRYGKVKIIKTAAFGTSIFSILGGFAFNLPSLVFFRAVNGAFGAGIFPVTLALVGQSFDDQNRHKAIGKVMGLMFLGGATATAFGGALAYIGSWRLVYVVYGVAELFLSITLYRALSNDRPVSATFNLIKAYKVPFSDYKFMRLVSIIFFVGFSVFGSFTYTGQLVQEITGYNLLIVGLILSFFGVGTVFGGRMAPRIKKKLNGNFLILAGIVGGISLVSLSQVSNTVFIILSLFGFGVAFIFLQSTLVATVQEKLPSMRGTAMSLASFNMFVGGAVGTNINGRIMTNFSTSQIFFNTSVLILIVGIIAALLVSGYEKSKIERANELS